MSFIQTLSGNHIDYRNISHDAICIEDIATALSHACRFAGHLPEFYSVAQHSVLVSQLVPGEFAFEALMHDAAEAYCCDIPAPLKALLPDYREIERYVDSVIREKYGLPAEHSQVVKYADLIMLATERRDLDIDDGTRWPYLDGISPTEHFTITPLSPSQASTLFINRFNELEGRAA
ncbi:HD family hydrolase [Mangrovibacter sp. SLW1]